MVWSFNTLSNWIFDKLSYFSVLINGHCWLYLTRVDFFASSILCLTTVDETLPIYYYLPSIISYYFGILKGFWLLFGSIFSSCPPLSISMKPISSTNFSPSSHYSSHGSKSDPIMKWKLVPGYIFCSFNIIKYVGIESPFSTSTLWA